MPLRWTAHVGARDQLAYYSDFGSRVDLAAPGGARRYNIPSYDGGEGDILYGGWGSLGPLDPSGETCTDPFLGSPFTFACFKVDGAGFGWLQGTSMSSPNVAGVAALTLSAHPELARNPSALVARLLATTRKDMTNYVGPNDPVDPAKDKRLTAAFYGIIPSTVDDSVWGVSESPFPGMLVRLQRGNNAPSSCRTQVFKIPAPGYDPRGVDIDSQGVVWTGLAATSHLASFDVRKCKDLTGPQKTDGSQCAEGWTLYQTQGPKYHSLVCFLSSVFIRVIRVIRG